MIFNLNKTRRMIGRIVRAAIVATVIITPLMVVHSVRAGNEQFIGETPVMSSGAGLVLFVSLQRS